MLYVKGDNVVLFFIYLVTYLDLSSSLLPSASYYISVSDGHKN